MHQTTRFSFLTAVAVGTLAIATATSHAKPTPTQACAAAKNKAAGKYGACLQTAFGNFAANGDVAKRDAARAKCRDTFLKAWAKAEAKAAKAGATCSDAPIVVDAFDASIDGQSAVLDLALSGQGLRNCGDGERAGSEACDGADLGGATCVTEGFALGTLRCGSGCFLDTSGCFTNRYLDNGDGTVTDRQSGLQWEQKNAADGTPDGANPHDVNNTYTLTATNGGTVHNGSAFTDFLARLNGASPNGTALTGCFATHCDWRIPTITELRSIIDESVCSVSGGPCVDPVFGPTVPSAYWSSTPVDTIGGATAWCLDMDEPAAFCNFTRDLSTFVRAVRTVRVAP